MDIIIPILIAAVIIAVLVIVTYNRLVALKQERNNAFADIDVQLRLRYDLIPNLVETVKAFAAHEAKIFEKVTEMRAKAMNTGTINEKIQAETQLNRSLMELYAVAENYPQLKSNENFGKLQLELSDIENKVAAARRFFNNATGELNTAIKQFPAIIFADWFGFTPEQFFDVGEEERKKIEEPVKVSF